MMIDKKIIKTDADGSYVNMKDVYDTLRIRTPYSMWVNRSIKRFNLIEYEDYWTKHHESTGGRPQSTHDFTLENAHLVAYREKVGAVIGYENRKEFCFFSRLETILKNAGLLWQNKILYQYAILNYRVDCYIPTLCLCIEYDELHHNSDSVKKRDKKRQKEIELSKEYHFIRVNEGSEDKGIGLIIKKAIDLI